MLLLLLYILLCKLFAVARILPEKLRSFGGGYKYVFAFVLVSNRLLFSFWRALCDGQRINKGVGARRAVAAAAAE